MNPTRKQSGLALYRRRLREARPFWPHLAGLFALSLAATPLTLLNPMPLKIVVDFQWITIDAFIPLLSSALTLVAMIVVMGSIDRTLALVALTGATAAQTVNAGVT